MICSMPLNIFSHLLFSNTFDTHLHKIQNIILFLENDKKRSDETYYSLLVPSQNRLQKLRFFGYFVNYIKFGEKANKNIIIHDYT